MVEREIILRWTGFGALMFCFAASSYFSKVIFRVLTSIIGDKTPDQLKRKIQRELELPVTILIALGFFYLAFFQVFPWDNYGIILNISATALRFVFDLVLFVAFIFVILRIIYAAHVAVEAFTSYFNVAENTHAVVSETVAISGVIIFLAVVLFTMKQIFETGPAASDVPATLIALVSRLNFFTASIMIAASPIFRDIIAGLTIFFEGCIHSGDIITVPGALSEVGVVKAFSLRNTIVQLKDNSLVTLPNRYYLTHPTINYSFNKTESGVLILTFTFPEANFTSQMEIRQFCKYLEDRVKSSFFEAKRKYDDTVIEISKEAGPVVSEVSVSFDENLIFYVKVLNPSVTQDDPKSVARKSEILLNIKEQLEHYLLIRKPKHLTEVAENRDVARSLT